MIQLSDLKQEEVRGVLVSQKEYNRLYEEMPLEARFSSKDWADQGYVSLFIDRRVPMVLYDHPIEIGATYRRIFRERVMQQTKGYDAKHDDEHGDNELADAAAAILDHTGDDWGIYEKHQNDRKRQLVIAAALIVAEIQRLARASV